MSETCSSNHFYLATEKVPSKGRTPTQALSTCVVQTRGPTAHLRPEIPGALVTTTQASRVCVILFNLLGQKEKTLTDKDTKE